MIKRIFDLVVASFLLLLLLLPMALIALLISITSRGPILFWSSRVGQRNKLFQMPKFRTMDIQTPMVATHLLEKPQNYVTFIGSLLRKTSFDELPQLWSILKGDMSFVGPRPALFNQSDLISLRTNAGVDKLLPGLTGWAQVNGRDDLPISEKVRLDAEYLLRRSFMFDLYILVLTVHRVFAQSGVSH